jgi:DNA gyrase inhibitor GyrI
MGVIIYLKKVGEEGHLRRRQASAEIQITPAMIEAGAYELARYDDAQASLEEGAEAIYRAMQKLELTKKG